MSELIMPKIQLDVKSKTIPITKNVIPRKMEGPSMVLSILLSIIKVCFLVMSTNLRVYTNI